MADKYFGGFVGKELHVSRLIYYPTLRCNLKCKLCSAYSPYYKNPYNPELSALCNEIEKFFSYVDQVGLIEIVGGEPLLRADLSSILNKFYSYHYRIKNIRVTTNGTIIPNDKIISAAKQFKDQIVFLLDDYGPNLSKNVDLAYQKLSRAHVPVEIRDNWKDIYGGGWWELGDFSLLWDDKQVEEIYEKCVIGKSTRTMNLIAGVLYQCATHRRAVELGVVPKACDEVINLYDEHETRESIRERISSAYTHKWLSACKYCPGRIKSAKRCPPAIQLENEK